MDFPEYSCHTQVVELCGKLVTECPRVKMWCVKCGVKARDDFICMRLQSRQTMPFFNTKAQYARKAARLI